MAAGGCGAVVLAIGAGEGAVAAEAAAEAAFRGAHAAGDQIPRQHQPPVEDICSHAGAGAAAEQAHHMEFA